MTENQKLREALRIFAGCATPVDKSIDARGHAWSEAYLDQALLIARQALALPTADHLPDAGNIVWMHKDTFAMMQAAESDSKTRYPFYKLSEWADKTDMVPINVNNDSGKMIETAASVGERDAFEHDLSKSPFEFDMDRWPDNAPVDWPGSYKQYHVQCAWDAWQARAALSAGDAVDAQRYRLVRRGQHFSIINGIGDTLRGEALDAAADAAMRKGQL